MISTFVLKHSGEYKLKKHIIFVCLLLSIHVYASEDAQSSQHFLKIKELEERLSDLKEKIFLSRAKLQSLQEIVLNGAILGSKLALVHKNEMGSSFLCIGLEVSLDGKSIVSQHAQEGAPMPEHGENNLYLGSLPPGVHQLRVKLTYQGQGFGIFSYLKEYTYDVESNYSFVAEEGRLTTIHMIGFEKGGMTTPMKERPNIRFELQASRELRKNK